MDSYLLLLRFFIYAAIGLSGEVVCSVVLINFALEKRIEVRAPRKYLEGFVSLYMLPVHGAGILFVFEPLYSAIASMYWGIRFLIWAVIFSATEAAIAFLMDKALGFYPWDYYALSRFKMFKRGYGLWILLPVWGAYGLMLELVVKALTSIHLS